MAVTRSPAECELGPVFLVGNPGCERVEFTDQMGRKCVLRQKAGSTSIALQVGDSYAVLPKHLQRSLVETLGRLLETGSMVNEEGCP